MQHEINRRRGAARRRKTEGTDAGPLRHLNCFLVASLYLGERLVAVSTQLYLEVPWYQSLQEELARGEP